MDNLYRAFTEIEIQIELLRAKQLGIKRQILEALSGQTNTAQTGEAPKVEESTTEDQFTGSPI